MAEAQEGVIDLAAHRWRHRPVLVFAPTTTDPAYAEQLAVFTGHEPDNADRDLLIGEFPARGMGQFAGQAITPGATAALRQQLAVAHERFAVLLIGKDGGVKLRSARPLAAEQIFTTIDQMPMRQQECQPPDADAPAGASAARCRCASRSVSRANRPLVKRATSPTLYRTRGGCNPLSSRSS